MVQLRIEFLVGTSEPYLRNIALSPSALASPIIRRSQKRVSHLLLRDAAGGVASSQNSTATKCAQGRQSNCERVC